MLVKHQEPENLNTLIGGLIPDAIAEHQEKKNVTSQEDIPWNSGIPWVIFIYHSIYKEVCII